MKIQREEQKAYDPVFKPMMFLFLSLLLGLIIATIADIPRTITEIYVSLHMPFAVYYYWRFIQIRNRVRAARRARMQGDQTGRRHARSPVGRKR